MDKASWFEELPSIAVICRTHLQCKEVGWCMFIHYCAGKAHMHWSCTTNSIVSLHVMTSAFPSHNDACIVGRMFDVRVKCMYRCLDGEIFENSLCYRERQTAQNGEAPADAAADDLTRCANHSIPMSPGPQDFPPLV